MRPSDESRSGRDPLSVASDGMPADELSIRITDLVEKTEQEVFHFIYRRLGNEATAWDLTQETFLRVWRFRDQFDQAQDGRSWVLEIARNVVVSDFRATKSQKRGAGKTISFDFLSLIINGQGQTGPSKDLFDAKSANPLDGLVLAESLEAMDRAADGLNQKDRDLYRLLREGRSAAEIARMTGTTVAAIASHQTRLLHKMRSKLSPPPGAHL
jgi:RNA polymerase sigma-70 factor (ECF subfamily)